MLLEDPKVTGGGSSFVFSLQLRQESKGQQYVITPKSTRFLFSPEELTYTYDGESVAVKNHKIHNAILKGSVAPTWPPSRPR